MSSRKFIELNKNENMSGILISGFSEPEEIGVWAVGTESIIRLPISGMRGRIRLAIKLSPHLDQKILPTQGLKISISSNVVFDAMIGFDQIVECELTELDIEGKEFLNVILNHSDATSPYEIGKSDDRRLLAFKLFALELVSVDEIYAGQYISGFVAGGGEIGSDTYQKEILRCSNSLILEDPIAPNLADTAKIKFNYTSYLNVLGGSGRHEAMQLFSALMPPAQIPFRINENNEQAIRNRRLVLRDHLTYPAPVPVSVYSIACGILWGEGLVTFNNKFVFLRDCFPQYLLNLVNENGNEFPIPVLDQERWKKKRVIKTQDPITCPIHPNLIYGHFLLEMLPRFYVTSLLLAMGLKLKVAFPNQIPDWVRFFVNLFFLESETIFFDKETEIIDAPSVIITSMMHNDYNFHPVFNLMIEDIYRRADLMANKQQLLTKKFSSKLYLSRSKVSRNKRLTNEAEVEVAMEAIGFQIVHPQELSLLDQISMFRGASYVAGEYTSALHGTMFSNLGTRVLCIDYHSVYQSSIGRIRQQPHCFVSPEDGNFRHWRLYEDKERTFSVDINTLIDMALSMFDEEEIKNL